MAEDVVDNNRLRVYATGATGNQHPLLSCDDNNMFRAVHDVFGHLASGCGFDRHGEDAAWLAHSQRCPPLARRAMTTQTRGQSSAFIWHHRGLRLPARRSSCRRPGSAQPMACAGWAGAGGARVCLCVAGDVQQHRMPSERRARPGALALSVLGCVCVSPVTDNRAGLQPSRWLVRGGLGLAVLGCVCVSPVTDNRAGLQPSRWLVRGGLGLAVLGCVCVSPVTDNRTGLQPSRWLERGGLALAVLGCVCVSPVTDNRTGPPRGGVSRSWKRTTFSIAPATAADALP